MLFTGVAIYHRGTMISTALISSEHFLHEGLLQINHEVFIKFQVAHVILLLRYYFQWYVKWFGLGHECNSISTNFQKKEFFSIIMPLFCLGSGQNQLQAGEVREILRNCQTIMNRVTIVARRSLTGNEYHTPSSPK